MANQTPCYAEIGGIPPWYTVADLRWYFHDYVEQEAFVTFHYNYRFEDSEREPSLLASSQPENVSQPNPDSSLSPPKSSEPETSVSSKIDDWDDPNLWKVESHTGKTSGSSSCKTDVCNSGHSAPGSSKQPEDTALDQANQDGSAASDSEEQAECDNIPGCCLVQMQDKTALDGLISDYNNQPWLDSDGNPIQDWTCRICEVILTYNSVLPEQKSLTPADLCKPPYSCELMFCNPYPRGNVATPRGMLMDFVAAGRIDADTAADLGLLDEDHVSEFASIAAEIAGDVQYAVIRNIPHVFRSRDLRAHFHDFIEYGGFLCFHYNHRPMEPGRSGSHCFCVVKMTTRNLEHLLETYEGHNYTNEDGDEVNAKCEIVPPTDQEMRTKKTEKDLSPALFPRGNVGTPVNQLWELYQQGYISKPVAKRIGLIDEVEAEGVEEDIQYEMRPDNTRHKISVRKLRKRRLDERLGVSSKGASASANPASRFAGFEAHSTGFGRKLMEKLGWKDGLGLGKDETGKYNPVAIEMNQSKSVGRRGLGDKSKKHKRNLPVGIGML